ncbi:electron transfer flavoprotein subunit alpha [Thermodesulfobacteriota bacterium]
MEQKPKKKKKPRGKARTIDGKCIACGARCQISCPVDAIEMNDKEEPIIEEPKCIGCKKCIKACPADAIEIYLTPEEEALLKEIEAGGGAAAEAEPEEEAPAGDQGAESNIALWNGVWVYIEQVGGKAHEVSWELLGKGRELADDLGVELAAFVLGDNIKHLAEEAFGYGADKVYVMDHPYLKLYRTTSYLHGCVEMVNKYKPEIVLMGATGLGRDLAGAVATDLKTGLTADCTQLKIDKKMRILEQTRPAFGGNIMATILTETRRPQMASVRPHVMPKREFQQGRQGEVIEDQFTLSEDQIPTKVLEIISAASESSVNIAGAKILVAGGRGMINKENFQILQDLAESIGGVVAGSRCAFDEGWIDHPRQVGQTGKTVHPKLYIACAISGAIQHLVGMQDSDYIIAINKDKTAPIFEVAHLGIVGDVFDIVPALIDKLKQSNAKIVE